MDPEEGELLLYWTDSGTDRIQRSNPDGSGVEDVVTGLRNPLGLALDPGAGKVYWTDSGTDKIQRSNLDGTEVEDVVSSGLRSPSGLVLDLSAGKLYWTDYGTDKIQRSNPDGTEVEEVVTGLRSPLGLALDVAAGKLYWSDYGTDKIQRSNLDGSGVEDVVSSGLRVPRGLALDAAAGKLYWTDSGTDKIQRSNLDGSEVEDVVTGLGVPRGLAVDTSAGKLYWSDSGTDKIQRSNLDGSGVEDVVTGLHTPARLALGPIAALNRAPTLSAFEDRSATAGDTLLVEAVGEDPDGDPLGLAAATSDSSIATARAADSMLTLFPLAPGQATITVRVRDPGGLEAAQTFVLTVQAPNQAPTLSAFEDRSATAGDTLLVEAVGEDPDGDPLGLAAATSDSSIATARAADSMLTLFPLAPGQATITVRVRDPGGLEAEQTFVLTVQAPNQAPVADWINRGAGRIQAPIWTAPGWRR